MKLSTLKKLPEDSRASISYAWRAVYIHKITEQEEGFQFVAGIIAGLSHANLITEDNRCELFAYYRRWFSL